MDDIASQMANERVGDTYIIICLIYLNIMLSLLYTTYIHITLLLLYHIIDFFFFFLIAFIYTG